MCNLYSLTKGQKAIIDLARAMRDLTGNLPPMPAVFPNHHRELHYGQAKVWPCQRVRVFYSRIRSHHSEVSVKMTCGYVVSYFSRHQLSLSSQ
jgi:hypothetical protein